MFRAFDRLCALPGRCVLLFLLMLPLTVSGEEEIRDYFEGLRDRRLFTVAEIEAQRRLAQPGLSHAERADLTIELSKTYAAHAQYATGDERRELWTRAEEVIGRFLRLDSETPFRALMMAQRAMVPVARGAQLRWQGELFPQDEAARQDAVALLRDALDRLEVLPDLIEEDLQWVLSTPSSRQSSEEEPAPSRLHALKRQVAYATATTWLDLARVLPAGADRTAALVEADTRFDALTRSARPDRIAWLARVHRLDTMRLRGLGDRLAGQVNSLVKQDPPQPIADAAVAVLVRWWLDESRPDEALATLEEHRKSHGLDSDELQALVVESLLAARQVAVEKDDSSLSDELMTRARAVSGMLTGPWLARTRLLISQAEENDQYGPELAATIREAQWAWRNRKLDEAITAWTRAAALAHQQGRTDSAVEFGISAASAQLAAEHFAAAGKTLSQLLEAYPAHSRSADADLLRAYVLAKLYEQDPSSERREAYRDALVRHREVYAGSATAAEATWMLARLAEFQQDWTVALASLTEIPESSKHYGAATARMATLYGHLIATRKQQGQPVADLQQEARQTLSQIASTFPDAPAVLTPSQSAVALQLARLLLHADPPEFAGADFWLKRVIDSGVDDDGGPDSSTKSTTARASQLRITSLAGQGRSEDARALLEQVAAEHPHRMLEILNGLTEVAAEIGIEHRSGVSQLQLELAQQLKATQTDLPEADQRQLELALAQAYAAVGRWQPAAQLYEEMLWKQPNDREVIAELALLYEACGSAGCLAQALKQWQALERLQRKGSVDWLTSRLHLARISHRLGDEDAARKLVSVTRLLYPKLGTAILKSQFEALAAELGMPQK